MLKFRKIIGLMLGVSLAVGLLGVGLNAALTMTGGVSEVIQINGMGITVSSTTPGATVDPVTGAVTCPILNINQSASPSGYDTVGCQMTVKAAGSISPSSVDITYSSSIDGGDKYSETFTPGGADSTLLVAPIHILHSSLPASLDSHISWGSQAHAGAGTPLTSADVGTSFTVSFAISATP